MAVISIIANSFSRTSLNEIEVNFLASLFSKGSESKTPSTFVPFTSKSQSSSAALKAAALSVLKYGLRYLQL